MANVEAVNHAFLNRNDFIEKHYELESTIKEMALQVKKNQTVTCLFLYLIILE